MKAQGREKEIQKAIKTLKGTVRTSIPKQLAYVSGQLFDQYIHDMKIVQEFAKYNRQAMMDELVHGMGVHVVEQFTTIHNYIDTEAMESIPHPLTPTPWMNAPWPTKKWMISYLISEKPQMY